MLPPVNESGLSFASVGPGASRYELERGARLALMSWGSQPAATRAKDSPLSGLPEQMMKRLVACSKEGDQNR